MMGNEASLNWGSVYTKIKSTHDAAYLCIDEAIKLEEQEKPSEAIEKYQQGIFLVDQALSIQVECPENPDITWEQARVMIQKMKKTKTEVLMRINSIQSSLEFIAPAPPPSYDEAVLLENAPRTYGELATALETLNVDEFSGPVSIIYTHDNVKLYFISPDGTVSSYSDFLTLKIGSVEDNDQFTSTFLQVGDWVYPLVPGVSPCYHTEYGAFILPDLQSEIPGSSVGIILPSDASLEVYDLLEDILHGVVSEKPLTPAARADRSRRATGISDTISRGIVTGAHYISQGLIKGAEKTGELLNYGTPKIINNIQPVRQAKPIPTNVQKGIEMAQDVTSTAVSVTGFIATKVGLATMALGRFLAPHVQKQGTRLLISGFNMSQQEASEKMTGVLTVAAGAVEGFSAVYTGLETSAGILGTNLTNNTVKIVEHKYGQPSGVLAGNTLHTMGNLITVSHNVSYITPKGIAKHTVKETGKAIVEDIRNDLRPNGTNNSNVYPSISLPFEPLPGTSKDIQPAKK